jgi:hypothetical protein
MFDPEYAPDDESVADDLPFPPDNFGQGTPLEDSPEGD